MILKVYGDESEMAEGGKRVITVAGLLNNPGGWESFEPAWKSVLDHYGVDVFHTTDFEARRPPYRSWSNAKRIAFMKALIEALGNARPKIAAVSTTILLDDYEAEFNESEKAKLPPPYDFCAQWTITTISAHLGQAKVRDFVAYVFEERQRQGRLVQAVEEIRAHKSFNENVRRIESITIAPKSMCIPLQAADLWAFEATKNILRHVGAHERPDRKSYLAMKHCMILDSNLWDRPKLRRLFEDFESGRIKRPPRPSISS